MRRLIKWRRKGEKRSRVEAASRLEALQHLTPHCDAVESLPHYTTLKQLSRLPTNMRQIVNSAQTPSLRISMIPASTQSTTASCCSFFIHLSLSKHRQKFSISQLGNVFTVKILQVLTRALHTGGCNDFKGLAMSLNDENSSTPMLMEAHSPFMQDKVHECVIDYILSFQAAWKVQKTVRSMSCSSL